jgi:hypothetical protein
MTDTELATINHETGEVLPPPALTLRESPSATLAAAQQAATALQDVISRKKKPVIFGGEQYLEYEDWMTCGRFFGITASVMKVEPVELRGVHGFRAVASAQQSESSISRAEALCMADEPNWKGKPLFQLASMAQTRACAKALRNVLAWVVVLAGYRPTPAEEMTRETRDEAPPQKARTPRPSGLITEAQQKRFFAIAKQEGWPETAIRTLLQREHLAKSSEIPIGKYDLLVTELKLGPPEPPATDDEAPF